MNSFATVGFVYVENKRILLVKSKKYNAYYVPGGKIEAGESDVDAIIREVKEEINVDLIPNTIKSFDTFEDQAHAKPLGTNVRIICFTGDFTGIPMAHNEIELVGFFSYEEYGELPEKAPAVSKIIEDLKNRKLIE